MPPFDFANNFLALLDRFIGICQNQDHQQESLFSSQGLNATDKLVDYIKGR